MNSDIVGPWRLKFVEECFPGGNEDLLRITYRLQVNKWIKSSRKSSKSTMVIVAILGNQSDLSECSDSYVVDGECSYWLADAKTLVRKTKKKIDTGSNPGDVISKGHFFLSVQYFSLMNLASFKYQTSDMPVAVVDFANVITTTRIYWNRIFRPRNRNSEIFQLDNRTHGLIVHQVKRHGQLLLYYPTLVITLISIE